MEIENVFRGASLDRGDTVWDAVIVASGYESRASSVAEELHKNSLLPKVHKYAWAFEEFKGVLAREKNDSKLKDLDFISPSLSGYNDENAYELFGEILDDPRIKTILIDVSSMTRAWYGAIIRSLVQSSREKEITVAFAYTPAVFSGQAGEFLPVEHVGPVAGFAGLGLPDLPCALVLGVGTEPQLALALKDHLDPAVTFVFRAMPGACAGYEKAMLDSNQDLFGLVDPRRIIDFPILDSYASFRMLESVCAGVRDNRLVLASTGPKIFSVSCLLLSVVYQDYSFWRASPGIRREPVDLIASGKSVMLWSKWV